MNEIKPTWRIAQEISRNHTFISLKIALPLLLASILIPIIMLKILGFPTPGVTLKHFYEQHRRIIIYISLFIFFIPINFYAIMRVLQIDYDKFQLKVLAKEK